MKIYLAIVTDSTLMDGNYEHVLGVFSSPELAIEELRTQPGFTDAEQKTALSWKNVFDGELTEYFEVIEAELDKGLHDY